MSAARTGATGRIDDIGYGRQFDGWYDRLLPSRSAALRTAEMLAGLHPDRTAGTLEFGVGTGRIALPLAGLVGRVTGVDSSPEMLAALRERARAEGAAGTAVTVVHGDMRTYAAPENRRYGLVYAVCATLNLVPDPDERQEVFHRAAALLIPGGRLVVECHNRPAVVALHEGRTRTSYFLPYPEPGTGVQTYSTLSPDHNLWHCSHIWHVGDGTTRVGTETSRLLTPEETDAHAKASGLRPLPQGPPYGDWAGTPYTTASPTFISVYESP